MAGAINVRAIIRYYDELLATKRDAAQAVGWRNRASQEAKFHEISQLFAHERSPFSVYDVGCGIAGLQPFLKKHFPLARYYGCDISGRMVEAAREEYPQVDVECRDISRTPPRRKYDYAVACGTFNICLKTSKLSWEVYAHDMLRVLYRIARRGIAVGFLSSFAEGKLASEYYPEPSAILSFVQRRLSPLAEIRHACSPGHFAVLAYRPSEAQRISRLRGPSLKSKSIIDSRGTNKP